MSFSKAMAVALLGQTVLFKSLHASEMGNGADEVPAIVTRVWGPHTVNLTVYGDNIPPASITSVTYDAEPTGQSRSWRFKTDAVNEAHKADKAAGYADP